MGDKNVLDLYNTASSNKKQKIVDREESMPILESQDDKKSNSDALGKFFIDLAQKLKEEKVRIDEQSNQESYLNELNERFNRQIEEEVSNVDVEDLIDQTREASEEKQQTSDALGKFFINLANTLRESKEKILAESQNYHPDEIEHKIQEKYTNVYLEALNSLGQIDGTDNQEGNQNLEKNKQIVSNQIAQEIENLKNQIFHLQMGGGGGGTNAVQYAKGGTMDGDLYVTGTVTSNNNIALGNGTIYGSLSTFGEATFFDNAKFEKDLTVKNALTAFDGNVFFEKNVTIFKNLSTLGNSVFVDSAEFSDDVTIKQNLSALGKSIFDDDVIANKNVTVYGNLSAEGNINFAQNVTVGNDLVVYGNLSAFGNSYIEDTIFSTTTAISVVNTGIGPALYVYQGPGDYHVASFVDGDGVEVLHIGNVSSLGGGGKIGINTPEPLATLHVSGNDGLILPVGNSSQRVNVQGTIRYNSQDQAFEGYDGSNWGSLGGVKDVDQNTYISAEDYPGADNNELKFFTDGEERMRILSAGNVGIGNVNPNEKLTVSGNISSTGSAFIDESVSVGGNLTVTGNLSVFGDATVIETTTTVTSAFAITNTGTGPALTVTQTGSNDIATFFDDSNTALIIKDGGNVGVGTESPSATLTVAGTLSTSGTVNVGGIGEGISNSVVVLDASGYLRTDEINPQIWDTTANFVSASDGSLEEGYIQKATNDGGIDKSVIFEDNAGKIGVGTNVPSTTFHISGNDGIVIPVGNTSQRVNVQGAIRYNSQDQAFEGYDGSNWGSLGGVKDVDQNTYISAEDYPGANNNELKFFTDGFERMRILSAGNVGIGVENPSKKLTVAGDISASGEASVNLLSSSSVSFVVENGGLLQKRFLELSIIPQFTFTKNLTVSIDPSKSFGRYKNLDIIQSMGKTVSEVLEMAVVEPITPTVQFSVTSPAILFNQTSITNTLAFSHQISSLGADTQSGTFEWKRSNESTWQLLSSSTARSGILTHNTTNTNFNTNAFNYRYLVVDTVGASASATANTTMQNYVQPTVSLTVVGNNISSPETNSSREKGNVNSTISGTITRQSSLVALQSYQLQYRVDSGAWQNVGSSVLISDGATAAIAATVHNPTGDASANSISYRVQITDAFGTTTAATTSTINFSYFIFYGPTASAPTNSTQVRSLPTRAFTGVLSNPFNLVTGTTLTNFTVALPTAVAAHDVITQVLDLDALNANITSNYVNNPFLVNDAAGNGTTYNVYTMTLATPYTAPPAGGHRHQITRA